MRKYDYSFLKEKHLNQVTRLSRLIAEINTKETLRKMQYEDVFNELRKKAIIDSVSGSNLIEGISTSSKRFIQLMEDEIPISHDEKELLGYKEALNFIHNNYSTLEISEELIKRLHNMIEKDVSEDAGEYKSINNYIMENDEKGDRRIRFYPVDYKDTPRSMNQLLLAYYDARQDEEIDQLLLAICFVLDFLCIHPFRDGNGRVSRLLMLLLFYFAGYDIGRYVSIENTINDYKSEYYFSLIESSKKWHENKNDYSSFIIYSLQILYRCYKSLDESLGEIALKKVKKNERIRRIVLNSLIPISKADIKEKLPDVSVRTIESELRKMIDSKEITKIGNYKDARYISNNQ